MRTLPALLLAAGAAISFAVDADDAEGCKDHPLLTRMPNFEISECASSEFDLKRYPVGPAKPEDAEQRNQPLVDVEGPFTKLFYRLKEGGKKPSELQIMRNYENALKQAGGTIEGAYPGWCKAMFDYESLNVGNGCMNWSLTGKIAKGGSEYWVFVHPDEEGNAYHLLVSQRQAMKQDVVANELLEKINKEGFVAVQINFDTGKATIKPDSQPLIDQIAAMLKSAPDLKLEIGGHTDNVGGAAANQKLSEDRAKAVMAALVKQGVGAGRLTAKGYGQTAPVADNRSEDGRAKNRRVELTKR
jgi:OOP family OmpA-OmpF porin